MTLVAEEIDALAGEAGSRLQAIEAELADVQSRLLRLYEVLEKSTLTFEALSPRILSLRQSEDQLAAARADAARQLTQRKVDLPWARRSRPTSRTSGASSRRGRSRSARR